MNGPIFWQRLEAAVVFGVSTYFYFANDFKLVWYVLLLFVFDVFMVGYLFNNKLGAHVYNFGHSAAVPLSVLAAGSIFHARLLTGLGFIWLAHIGLDRALGYGLKLTTAFHDTHLGKIGKKHHTT